MDDLIVKGRQLEEEIRREWRYLDRCRNQVARWDYVDHLYDAMSLSRERIRARLRILKSIRAEVLLRCRLHELPEYPEALQIEIAYPRACRFLEGEIVPELRKRTYFYRTYLVGWPPVVLSVRSAFDSETRTIYYAVLGERKRMRRHICAAFWRTVLG